MLLFGIADWESTPIIPHIQLAVTFYVGAVGGISIVVHGVYLHETIN